MLHEAESVLDHLVLVSSTLSQAAATAHEDSFMNMGFSHVCIMNCVLQGLCARQGSRQEWATHSSVLLLNVQTQPMDSKDTLSP